MAASNQSHIAVASIARILGTRFSGGEAPPDLRPKTVLEVIRIGRTNKILKPLLTELSRLSIPIPNDAGPIIAAYSRMAMKSNAAALATLCEVTKSLSEAGILHAAFKGPARQITLGQDVFERPVADVDILVTHSDFVRATNVLRQMEYWVPQFCDSPWWRYYLGEHPLIPADRNRVAVDLHHRTQHPSCPRPRDENAMLNDLRSIEVGGETVPVFGLISVFLNTVMSVVKGLANREPAGGHVLDLARQLAAADDQRLAEFECAARDQGLEKSYSVAKRAVLVMTGLARDSVRSWFVPDDELLAMLLTPEDPKISWPRHTKLLWKLVDGESRFARAAKFTREFSWWTAAEFTRRTHDVSLLPARAESSCASLTPA